MANDTPFVALPSPPRSPSQTDKSADTRGYSFGPTEDDDDDARARAYAAHMYAVAKNVRDNLMKLTGSHSAAVTLWRKTMALTEGAPAYVESED